MGAYHFPPEFVSPKKKELPEYGLQYILAAWGATDRFGAGIFADDLEIQSLIEIAQGRQSTDNIRKLFGQFDIHRNPTYDGPSSLVYIDPQVLNLAPKYVNRAVAKMQMRQFDVGLEAIDLLSINERLDFTAAIQTYFQMKDFATNMGVPPEYAFEGLNIQGLPENPDELYDTVVNPKLNKEIAGELGLQLVQSMNNFKQKMRQVDWNMVVTGWGHLDCYPDNNGLPRIKIIPHEHWGGAYVENDDFEPQEYAFYLEPITVNQFIKEAAPYYNERDLKFLAYKYSIQNSQFTEGIYSLDGFDNLSYIPVVRFYFLSEDNRTFVTRNNQYGSPIIMERDFNYSPSPDVLHRYEEDNGDSRIIRNRFTSVYGGSWIVGSNVVYNYGRKNIPRTNLVNVTLPIKTFATNYKNGRAVSFTSQIVEPLNMINTAWNKVKETLGKGWIGIRNLDIGAIEQTALGKGGAIWTPREVVEYLNMSNTAVGRRTAGNQFGQSNGDIVTITQSGVQLADYFNTITLAVNFMDQLTGQSVIESANVPDRLPAKAIPQAQFTSDIDMEYLYNAHEYLYERTCHILLLLMQEAMKNPDTAQYFMASLSKVGGDSRYISKELAYCDLGIRLTKKPSPEEWIDFYQDVRLALEAGMKGLPGGIKLSDAIFLREVDNLKQARQVMVLKEAQYRREMMEMKQQDNQMAMEANQAAAQSKFQFETAIKGEQGKIDAYLKELQGKIDMMKQDQKAQLDGMTRRIGDEMSKFVKDMEGRFSVVKEAMRSQSEKYQSDNKLEGDIYKANKAAEKAEKQAKKVAKAK